MLIDSSFIEKYLMSGKFKENLVFENCPEDLMWLAPNCFKVEFDNVKALNVVIDKSLSDIFNERTKGIGYLFKLALAQSIIASLVSSKALRRIGENEKADEIDLNLEKFFRIKGYFNEFYKKCPKQEETEQLLILMPPFEINFFFDKTDNEYLSRAVNEYMFMQMPENVKIFCCEKLPSKYNLSGRKLKEDVNYRLINISKDIEDEQEKLSF
ncbi:MAG: hypothetical protein K6F08_01440 [bacterium]|nr:hypothetical protein [bacterium]